MHQFRPLSLGFAAALCAASAYLLYPVSADGSRAANPVKSSYSGKSPGFAEVPPVVQDIYLTARPRSEQGNALLDIRYAADQGLPETIVLKVGDRDATLSRDPKNADRYTAIIDFDFDAFVEEQRQRKKLVDNKDTVANFSGREFLGRSPVVYIDPDRLIEMIDHELVIHVPIGIGAQPASAVFPEHALMVTDPSVVDDPARTFDACTGLGNPNGAWTFNKLMTDMANQPNYGTDPALMVEEWLQSWNSVSDVNSFPVGGSHTEITSLLAHWPRLSDGRLDLAQSPMRLLAIVNRMDLRTNRSYADINTSAGEGRFVFGAVIPGKKSCRTLKFTVNLEYALPLEDCPAIRQYATRWHGLGNLVLGSPIYNARLQGITAVFAGAGADPSKPNGSAIRQVRTNDETRSSFGELREFNFAGGFYPVPTAQTPDLSFNHSITLARYVNFRQSSILSESHRVPLVFDNVAFLAGSSINDYTVWSHPAIVNNKARHLVSLNTCNGCHGGETATVSRFHVNPRQPGAEAALSDFLTGAPSGGTLQAPATYHLPDPIAGETVLREFGDLIRRQRDLNTLVLNGCASSAVPEDLRFQPISGYSH